MRNRLLFGGYFLTTCFLFLYSFTQVDLSLTLSQLSLWQIVQKKLQYIGYFQRPIATDLYIVILLLLFSFFFFFQKLVKQNKITQKKLWIGIIVTVIVLGFSYNAFSYDIFNYIFDAKLVTHYQVDPYRYRALDFPKDPMLPFMRWIHRTYPYGPVWLAVTVPLSYLGMNYFLLTFFLFKTLMAVSYLGSVYFISKIAKKMGNASLFPIVFFALNPLVIIESLVSAHNDIVMMCFALAACYFLLTKKYFFALLFLLLSIGVKFATIFLIPAFLLYLLFEYKKKPIRPENFFLLATFGMIIAIVLASVRTNFQPWYLLYAFPFAAPVSHKYFVRIPVIIFSFFALLEYVPYLYTGNWNNPVPQILFFLTLSAFLLSVLVTIGCRLLLVRRMQK